MASVFNKGPHLPVGITPKVRVTSADTTADFLDNKVAINSPISKVVLNPGGIEQLQIIKNVVGAIWIMGGAHTSSSRFYTSSSAATFVAIAMNGTSGAAQSATVTDVQMRLPKAVIITALYVRMDAVLTGGQTLQTRFNINGSTSSTISVTHTSSTGTLNSAIGSLELLEDDNLAVEHTFGGGLGSKPIICTVAYLVEPD